MMVRVNSYLLWFTCLQFYVVLEYIHLFFREVIRGLKAMVILLSSCMHIGMLQ